MRYSFNAKAFNNWKGVITERLVEFYIEDIVIPSLKEEWDYAIFTVIPPFLCTDSKRLMKIFGPSAGLFFLSNGLFPTSELLLKMEKLAELIGQFSAPDGFLFKFKKTGETKTLKEAFAEFGRTFDKASEWNYGTYIEDPKVSLLLPPRIIKHHIPANFIGSEHDKDEQLPVVNGEAEVVEVKSGKGDVKSHQRKEHIELVNNGFPLRYIHVEIISFEKNQFEIKEKVVRGIDGRGKILYS